MNYVPWTVPRAHQVRARELSRGKKVFAYLCEMGTGKSKMIIDEWAERVTKERLHDLLILAPAGSYLNWAVDKSDEQPSQLRAHLSPDLFKTLQVAVWRSGAGKEATARLNHILQVPRPGRPRVFVVNIEALSSVRKAAEACAQFLTAPGRRSMMVIDESTTCRNDTIRTREVMKLKDLADLRRILTGMVTPRSPLDLYYQFEFLDNRILGYNSIHPFKFRYCVTKKIFVPGRERGKPRTVRVIVGYKNIAELHDKIAPYSYRVLKEDCLDLPPKIYQIREVQLTKEQRQIYDDLVAFSTAELSATAHVTATMVITKLLRLHQVVCGHTVDELGNEHDVKSNRISELIDLLAEHNGKVIIWSNYRKEIEKIVAALEKEYGEGSVAQFHGGVPPTKRLEQERAFLSDPKCRFMIATQSAGGRGNTWVVANLVVYFSNSHDLEMRLQSEDRAHRDGLKHSVTYVDLVAPNTIDEKILKALRKKLNMATLISGEDYREWLI